MIISAVTFALVTSLQTNEHPSTTAATQIATVAIRSLSTGDSAALAKCIDPAEISALGITRDQVQRIIKAVAMPAFRQIKVTTAPRVSQYVCSGHFGDAFAVRFKLGSTKHFFTVVPVVTENGKASVSLSSLIYETWRAQRWASSTSKSTQTKDQAIMFGQGMNALYFVTEGGLYSIPNESKKGR